jgi:hypothetical protein
MGDGKKEDGEGGERLKEETIEGGPVVVPNERDYAAAKDAEGGKIKRWAHGIRLTARTEGGKGKNKEMGTRCSAHGARRKGKDSGALRLLNTLVFKIRCEIPLTFAGRNTAFEERFA